MKKFIKYGTIFGCIFVLGGAGVATAAFALGAEPGNIADFFEEKFVSRYDTHYGYHNDPPHMAVEPTAVYHHAETIPADPYIEESNVYGETRVTMENTEPYSGERETGSYGSSGDQDGYTYSYSSVTDLEFLIADGYVETYIDSELSELLVMSEEESRNGLHFSDTERYQKLEVRVNGGDSYRIGIPADWKLNSLEIEVIGGQFFGEVPEIREADFTARGGEITVTQKNGQYTDMECIGGTILWSGSGEKTRTIDVECSTGGTVDMNLIDYSEPESIGYDVEYEDATVDFYGMVWQGHGTVGRKSQNGMAYLELEADAGGTITIH